MSPVTSRTLYRESGRRYLLRLALRASVFSFIVLFFIPQDYGYAAIIGLAMLTFYTASFALRQRSEQLRDLLMTLGDLPALIGVVHLPAHAPAFEVLVPVWLVGTTIANLRRGQPTLLPFYSLTAWLVLVTHAGGTADPLGYAIVQTLAVVIASFVVLAVVRERRTNRTDPLTGVLTRGAGLEELELLSKREGHLALAFIDLRGFKAVNDQHGHAVGDEVLSAVAGRLRHALRPDDVLLRYGGDEFIAASSASALEARLREAFRTPVKTQSVLLEIEARIGVQHISGVVDIDAVVREADRRMYADSRAAPPVGAPSPMGAELPSPSSAEMKA